MGIKFEIELWQFILGIIGLIAWAIRVENVGKQNKKDIEILWTKHDDLNKDLRLEISEMSKALSRIEGFLSRDRKNET